MKSGNNKVVKKYLLNLIDYDLRKLRTAINFLLLKIKENPDDTYWIKRKDTTTKKLQTREKYYQKILNEKYFAQNMKKAKTSIRIDKTIEQLEKEIDDLSTKLIDLTFELNYNKEKELLELVREIYKSINEELVCKESRLTKKQILMNIKRYLEEFAKNTKLKL